MHTFDPTVGAASTPLLPLPIDVVSVQSQVVYGRVGNNVALPALDALGLTAAAVPTVAFSNTPHYPTIHGGPIPLEWFEGYLRDLFARDALGHLKAILAGYLGSAGQARALGAWIAKVVEARPDVRVVIDPVIGDYDSGEYVSPDMVDAYRRHLLSLADGMTPNGFELERLTGLPARDIEGVVAAARTLLVGRTQWVTVTSAAPDTWAAGAMRVVVVTRDRHEIFDHPRVDATPKGTGDLFSAVVAGRLATGATVFEAVGAACGQVVSALRLTFEARSAELLLPRAAGAAAAA
ncbi:bifunctional pyridoxal kinase/hydroxymethylpyrimidine kinase [Bordetella genomosp. 10]|uniref:pyridoxal kinase n=1 Tax=Bordetella genomosp. 10 TaxID=1416804 RepID=A0A261SBF9_9BORD|nr:pyridoxine/pyridoxal/pyridoxamine kinase [Bordetella genomosp. 10]OZI34292.1 bifunctional pyridoxal kinase/hydroxymethylpyrimidine kinase [Bordetella genomosp. 10]